MADNTLALQVNANPIDLQKTIGTLSQLQLAQAHAGLYGLQAQQEARKLHGLEYLQTNPSDYQGAIARGLDPSVGSTLQIMGERQRQYGTNPQGLSTESASQLTTAGKNIAETGKIGVETDTQKMQNMGRIAQGYLADPTEESWRRSITDARARGYVNNDMQAQQFLAVKDPKQRERIASSLIMGGVSPAEATAQHNVEPTQAVTSRMGTMNPPTPTNINPNPAVANGILDRPALPVAGANKDQTRLPSTPVGTLPPQMTPGVAAEQKGYGEQMAKVLPALAARADLAKQQNFTLDQMKEESKSWDMGKGATTVMRAEEWMQSIAARFGSHAFEKPVGDFQSFVKNTGTLTRQAVKEVSSRASQQEFNLIAGQLPGPTMSLGGFQQIVGQMQAVNDFDTAKHQNAQTWRQKHGTMDGFESAWNKNVGPSAFLVNRLHSSDPAAVKTLFDKLDKTPEGRAAAASVIKQIQWAKTNELF